MRPTGVQRRRALGVITIIAGLLVGFFGVMAAAQTPNAHDASAAALIGVAVFSTEGIEVGTVSAMSVAKNGQITEIRMTTSAPRGLGERTVAVAQGSFTVLDGAVVIDLSADEVDALPVQTVLRPGTSA